LKKNNRLMQVIAAAVVCLVAASSGYAQQLDKGSVETTGQVGVVADDVHPGLQQRLDLGPLGDRHLNLGPAPARPAAVQHAAQVVAVDPDRAPLPAGPRRLPRGGQAARDRQCRDAVERTTPARN